MKIWLVNVLAVLLVIVPVLLSAEDNTINYTAEAIKRGEYLFKGACGAYCHSTTAELRDAPYLFDCEWIHGGSDEAIFTTIYKGVPDTRMPGFADKLPNGEDDIRQLIAYLKANRQSC